MSYTVNCTRDGLTRYPLHTHKNYEIMFYLEGQGFMQTEYGPLPFRRGTVIIMPPHVRHGSLSENGFKNISVEGAFDGYLHAARPIAIEDSPKEDGAALANMILENRYGSPAYLAALCAAYACFLAERINVEGGVQKSVSEIVSRISERAFDGEIDLASLLSQSGYAEDYIRSHFKRITGKTPKEFLTEIRIRHACFLIDVYGEELSLARIAEKCGYTDYPYFSKKFRSVMNLSPRDYRDL